MASPTIHMLSCFSIVGVPLKRPIDGFSLQLVVLPIEGRFSLRSTTNIVRGSGSLLFDLADDEGEQNVQAEYPFQFPNDETASPSSAPVFLSVEIYLHQGNSTGFSLSGRGSFGGLFLFSLSDFLDQQEKAVGAAETLELEGEFLPLPQEDSSEFIELEGRRKDPQAKAYVAKRQKMRNSKMSKLSFSGCKS